MLPVLDVACPTQSQARIAADQHVEDDMKAKKKLTPPDKKQCQGLHLDGSFMTLGPRSWVRCTSKPTVIVTEKKSGEDGQKGSMSLCAPCKEKLIQQRGKGFFTEKTIKKKA
jgi:hypothetical protein